MVVGESDAGRPKGLVYFSCGVVKWLVGALLDGALRLKWVPGCGPAHGERPRRAALQNVAKQLRRGFEDAAYPE